MNNKQLTAAFDGGNRSLVLIWQCLERGLVEPDPNSSGDGTWRLSELGLYYLPLT